MDLISILDNPIYRIKENLSKKPEIKRISTFKTPEGKFSIWDIDSDHRRVDMFTVFESPGGWIVRNVLIPDEYRRQGIATDAYLMFNILSKRYTKKPLRSTQSRTLLSGQNVHELSELGQKLWDSFVAKGLAVKLSDKNYVMK